MFILGYRLKMKI